MVEGAATAFGGEYGEPEYAFDEDFIYFRGLLKVPAASAELVLAKLPEVARPTHRRVFTVGDANTPTWRHLMLAKANGDFELFAAAAGGEILPTLDDLQVAR